MLRPGSDIWRQGPGFPSSILAGHPSSPRCPEVPPRSPVLLPGPSSCLAAGQQVSPLDSEWVRWDQVQDPVLPVAPFQTSSITEGWQRGRLWRRVTGAAGSWNRWAQGEAVSASSGWTHTVRKEPDGPRCRQCPCKEIRPGHGGGAWTSRQPGTGQGSSHCRTSTSSSFWGHSLSPSPWAEASMSLLSHRGGGSLCPVSPRVREACVLVRCSGYSLLNLLSLTGLRQRLWRGEKEVLPAPCEQG